MSEPVQTSAVGAFPAAIQAWTPSCSTAKKAFVVFSLIVAGTVVAAVIWRWRTQSAAQPTPSIQTPTQASADRKLVSPSKQRIAKIIFDNFNCRLKQQMDGCTIGGLDAPKKETELRQCYIQKSRAEGKNFVFFPEMKEGFKSAYAGTFYFKLAENCEVVLKAFIVGDEVELKEWKEDNTFVLREKECFAQLKADVAFHAGFKENIAHLGRLHQLNTGETE